MSNFHKAVEWAEKTEERNPPPNLAGYVIGGAVLGGIIGFVLSYTDQGPGNGESSKTVNSPKKYWANEGSAK